MKKEVEIIQQWQFLGKVHPKLLKDKVFEDCKKAGITSLQSYLYWAEIEKEPGKIDFSSYDILVEKLKKHDLKWVPFLILGPNYATPDWFKESKESIFAKCLEHQKESKTQSIWNSNLAKYVDRFLKMVAEHYQDQTIFESIALGISGNWGEAIYPADGRFYGNFHTHLGWWCGDKHALSQFRSFKKRSFPTLERNKQKELFSFIVGFISQLPEFLKKWLKFILKIRKGKFLFVSELGSRPQELKTAEQRENWLDFVNWYLDSMTDFAEFWLKTARKYFPETKIYLVTGGSSHPALGADFSRQGKIVAKYKAGIRITNQTNDYAQSFILSRLVASACRFYGSYFTTEEAAVLQSPEGVVMRIFDAVSSRAKGIYCKNFISIGGDPCIKKNLPVGEVTVGTENLAKNLQYLTNEEPIIKTAVFFPNTTVAFNPEIITDLYNQCSLLRDVLDFDLIDENMIKDGALEKYQSFLVLEGKIPEGEVSVKVNDWVGKGGILTSDPKVINNDIDNKYDGVYATRFEDKILYYNSTSSRIKKKIPLLQKEIEIEPNSILSVSL